MRRLAVALLSALTASLALIAAPAAHADTHDPGVARPQPAVHQVTRSDRATLAATYWTPKRMRNAVPRGMAASRRLVRQQTFHPQVTKGAPRVVRGAYASSQLGGPWTGGGAVVRTTGKVFFRSNGNDYACSGSVVPAENHSTVMTAGHCVKPAGSSFASSFVFVPGYHDGRAPYGIWQATTLITTSQWGNRGDLNYDVGFAVVAPKNGWRLEQIAGSQSISFNRSGRQFVYAFGYPASAPYDGSDLDYCADTATADTVGRSRDHGIDCNLTDGSSGGPWLADFHRSTGRGVQVSLNSFGYQGQQNVMYGPYFGSVVERTYDTAVSR